MRIGGDIQSKFILNNGFCLYSQKLKNSLKNSKQLLNFFTERAELEEKYASGLLKISKNYSNLLNDETLQIENSWKLTLDVINQEADCHLNLANSINREIVRELEKLNEDLFDSKKPVESFIERTSTYLIASRQKELRERKKSVKLMNKTANLLISTSHNGKMSHKESFVRENGTALASNKRSTSLSQSISSASSTSSRTSPNGDNSLANLDKWKMMTLKSISDYFNAFIHSEEVRLQWNIDYELSLDRIRQLQQKFYKTLFGVMSKYTETVEVSALTSLKNIVSNKKFDNMWNENISVDQMKKVDCNIFDQVKKTTGKNVQCLERYHDKMISTHEVLLNSNSDSSGTRKLDKQRKPLMYFGLSRQLLIDVPDEEFLNDSTNYAESSRKDNNNNYERKFLKSTSLLRSNSKLRFLSTSDRTIISKYYNMNFNHLLCLIVKEITKERLTKNGIVNLLTIYESQPFFSDKKNLFETRRSLYLSYNKLQHLTYSLRKLLITLSPYHPLLQKIHKMLDRDSGTVAMWKKLMSNDLREAAFNRHAIFSSDTSDGPLLRWLPLEKKIDYGRKDEFLEHVFDNMDEMKQEHILTAFEECLLSKAQEIIPKNEVQPLEMIGNTESINAKFEFTDNSSSLEDFISKTDDDIMMESDFEQDCFKGPNPMNDSQKLSSSTMQMSVEKSPCFEFVDALQINGFEEDAQMGNFDSEKSFKNNFFKRTKLRRTFTKKSPLQDRKMYNVEEKTFQNLDMKSSMNMKKLSIFAKLTQSFRDTANNNNSQVVTSEEKSFENSSLAESITMPSIFKKTCLSSDEESFDFEAISSRTMNSCQLNEKTPTSNGIIGWAKVVKSFIDDDSVIKSGEIVTIMSKKDNLKWICISNGNYVECPVESLKEF